LRPLESRFGSIHVDLVSVFSRVSENGCLVPKYLQKTAADGHEGLLTVFDDTEFPWIEHGQKRSVTGQYAQFAVDAGGHEYVNFLGVYHSFGGHDLQNQF
jgi:hypothetical protein